MPFRGVARSGRPGLTGTQSLLQRRVCAEPFAGICVEPPSAPIRRAPAAAAAELCALVGFIPSTEVAQAQGAIA
jgi:hypothetical protein